MCEYLSKLKSSYPFIYLKFVLLKGFDYNVKTTVAIYIYYIYLLYIDVGPVSMLIVARNHHHDIHCYNNFFNIT